MKIKKFFKQHKRLSLFWVLAIALVAAGGIAGYFWVSQKSGTESSENMNFQEMNIQMSGENIITASGVTSVGMTEEKFEVEDLETKLLIEEVYISSNEEIDTGTKILKLSDDTVAEARKELERKLTEADLACRAGTIEYEQNKITAKYDYDLASLNGKEALEIYNETIANLEDGITEAEEVLSEAKEDIAEYQAAIAGNTYYTDYEVEAYQKVYDENLELLKSKMEEWGVSWEQVTGRGMGGGGNTSYAGILSSLYSVLEQNLKDYEQAESDYEEAVKNAQFNLQTLELNVSTLEKNVTEAKENYDIQLLKAKLTYETALSNAESAKSNYDAALEKAASDYETLKDAREDAETNLALFESSVGDGCYYAAGKGTILRAMLRSESYLTSDSIIFVYSNPEEMTVTVSVDQSDIANIQVGDSVYVQSSDKGGFQGTVTKINPVSSSGSKTNVTYSVTVQLGENTGTLTTNKTVTVIFGIGGGE